MLKAIVADDDAVFTRYVERCADWPALYTEIVCCAHNGAELLELCHRYQPEILVLDIEMPWMNGLQCIEQLRSEGNRSQILLITGRDEFRYAQEGAKLGVHDILLKPVSKASLDSALRRLVNRYWALQASSAVLRSIVEKDRSASLLCLLDEDTPDNSVIRLCNEMLSAAQEGADTQLENCASAYVNSFSDLSVPFNHIPYIYSFPLLACSGLLRQKQSGLPLSPFDDDLSLFYRMNAASGPDEAQKLLCEIFCQASAVFHAPSSDISRGIAEKALDYMCRHYADPQLSISEVADQLHFHESYLRRVFKTTFGKTPGTMLREIRMREAKRLLESGSVQIQQVSRLVGFEDPAYFSKCYKHFFGYPPSLKE